MDKFNLKYGTQSLELAQSDKLLGLRPRKAWSGDATAAVQRVLGNEDWSDTGTVGGFRIISVDDFAGNTDEALDMLRADDSIQTGTHVFELPNDAGVVVPTGDLFVEFKAGATDSQRQAVVDEFKLTIKEARGDEGFILSVTPASPNPIKVAAALQANSSISIAEPDLASRIGPKAAVADAYVADQWHLRNTGMHRGSRVGFVKGADARVVDAWAGIQGYGRAEVIVAVIDDGFDLTHPDLAMPGKVVHPWDFSRNSADPRPGLGDWHGTACAGVAVASLNGGSVIGAAPGCTLMPIRWGRDLSDAQLEAWFTYAASKGASVVSCSWGARNPYFPLSTRAYRAITSCARNGRGGKGCVIVFAAGNLNHDIDDPVGLTVDGFATHPDVIAVAACTSRDERSDYSNFGQAISVCAPSSGAGGWGILTSDVTGVDSQTGMALGYSEGDYTGDFGGTSSACPLVAGICGLVLSIRPDLTAAEVKDVLQHTARKIGPSEAYQNNHSPLFGYGCVDAAAAIRSLLPGSRMSPSEATTIPQSRKHKTDSDEIRSLASASVLKKIDWRLAKSLEQLLKQINEAYPRRKKTSDGTKGDAAHSSRESDHNPWVLDGAIGVVTGMDITHDPERCDAGEITKAIVDSRDKRVKYVIWNKQICKSSSVGSAAPWTWRPYRGTNPHDKHFHVSVRAEKSRYDLEEKWVIQ